MPTGPERTLEVNYMNGGERFVAYYGYGDKNAETMKVQCTSSEPSGQLGIRSKRGFWPIEVKLQAAD